MPDATATLKKFRFETFYWLMKKIQLAECHWSIVAIIKTLRVEGMSQAGIGKNIDTF